MKHKKFKYKWISLALITAVATTGISAILISCKDNPRKEVEKLKDQLNKNENQTQRPTFSKPSVTLEANTKLIKKADNKYELKLKISNANNKLVKVQLVSQVVATSSNNNLISDFANVNNGEVTAVFSNLDEDTSYNLKSISLYANKADTNPLIIKLSQSTKATQLTVLKADNHDNHTDHKDHDHSNHKMDQPNKNDSKKEAEKPPVENPKASAPVATGEYKISFANPNNVIYQKGGKWYIKLKIENGEGHTGLVQVVSSSGSINTKNAVIKDNILNAEFSGLAFQGTIKPNRKYKLKRIDITDIKGNKTEIRNFDPSISGEITPTTKLQNDNHLQSVQSGNSGTSNMDATNINNSISNYDTIPVGGLVLDKQEDKENTIIHINEQGKYVVPVLLEQGVQGYYPLVNFSNTIHNEDDAKTGNTDLTEYKVESASPGTTKRINLEIPNNLVEQLEAQDGFKIVYIKSVEWQNEDGDVQKIVDLTSKHLLIKLKV